MDALPSRTTSSEGDGEAPVMTIPSMPHAFAFPPKNPPQFASKIVPVRGDFETALNRPDVGAGVPVKGPREKIRRHPGS